MTTYHKLFSLIFTVIMSTAFSSCSERPEKQPVREQAEGHHDAHEAELSLSAQQMEAIDLQIGKVEQKNLTAVVKASGQLAVPPQNEAKVNVLAGGIIRKIVVLEGQKVKKGQTLAIMENQEMIKLQQEYLSTKSGFSFVAAEYSRQQQLKAAGAGTGKAFQQSEANYQTEQSHIRALESQLRQIGISPSRVSSGNITSQIPILAPISGTIGLISVTTGAYVQPGNSLMDIVDNSKIHADLLVYEKDLNKVKIGQHVSFRLTNQDNQQIEGVLNGINKSFENDTKGVIVHAVISNPMSNLIPGMYVTGLISVGNALSTAVPVDALIKSAGKEYIFIVADEEAHGDEGKSGVAQPQETHFKKIEVVSGVAELGYISITPIEKLPEHTQVVTKGAFYLQSKSSGPAEHDH